MNRAMLIKLFAGQITLQKAVSDGSVTISGIGYIQALPSIVE